MVSKFNKTEGYQECTSVFFDFVHDVLRLLIFYYYPPTQKTFLPLYLKNAGRGLKNHYMFPSKGSINNGKKTSKRWVCNFQVVS